MFISRAFWWAARGKILEGFLLGLLSDLSCQLGSTSTFWKGGEGGELRLQVCVVVYFIDSKNAVCASFCNESGGVYCAPSNSISFQTSKFLLPHSRSHNSKVKKTVALWNKRKVQSTVPMSDSLIEKRHNTSPIIGIWKWDGSENISACWFVCAQGLEWLPAISHNHGGW